jgi:hypothetical protein
MAGYRTRGRCRPYLGGEQASEDLHWLHVFCPWTLELDVEYNGSVFESDLLRTQYRRFLGPADPADIRGQAELGEIGFVPGMAASMKTTLGPVSLVAEWNGALETAHFVDDLFFFTGRRDRVSLKPRAWQVSLAYQFGWKPSIEAIGAQGTYLTIGYSESRDLGGVRRLNENDLTMARVGAVPRRRLVVGVGEWVLPNLRLALEWSRAWDYSNARRVFPPPAFPGDPDGVTNGATRKVVDAILSMVTFEW